MEDIKHQKVDVNGITMHVAEMGCGDKAVLFLHGFPELWYSWRHQMLFLASNGYRCIAPDMRGFGETSMPPSPSSYTAFHIVGDIVALLDVLNISQAFVVGHDWGAQIAWYLSMLRPDRVRALVNLSIPFLRGITIREKDAVLTPTEQFKHAYGEDYYLCHFQNPGVEEEIACRDIKLLFKKCLADPDPGAFNRALGKSSWTDEDISLPSWLSEEDITYFASTFERTGFAGGMNYYRCLDKNWELAAPWAGVKIQVPTKLIIGDRDLVYHWVGIKDYIHSAGFKSDVPLLEEVVIIEGAGHFIQQEKAQEISDHICNFIKKL